MPERKKYLRRILTELEWIGSRHDSARVTWGARDLGEWKQINAGWRPAGNSVRLQISWKGQSLLFQIFAIVPGSRRTVFRCRSRCRTHDDVIVTWEESRREHNGDREEMEGRARAFLRRMLPGCRMVSISRAVDRVHSLSGKYLRLRARHRRREHLLLACMDENANEDVSAMLTQGLLWLALLRRGMREDYTPTVHLLAPAVCSAVLCHRSGLINRKRARVKVWGYEKKASGEWEVHKPLPPAAPLENRDFCWPFLGPFRWSPLLARVIDLAPGMIQRYPRFRDYDSLRILGLEFARAAGRDRDRILYGVGSRQEALTDGNFADCRALVEEILYYRRADSPAPDHPYYRMQPERWLEGLLLAEATYLFPELEPGAVYPQIPVYLLGTAGRADVLGADRQGNLVVMELKVSADPEMAMQSLDYWGRVITHNRDGDFEKRGYFPTLRLSRARPRIYLVSPVFQFHDSLETVLRCLDPRLEIVKIAVNEDWRSGVKILRRTGFRCGELK